MKQSVESARIREHRGFTLHRVPGMPVLNQLKLPFLTTLGESQVEENRPGYLSGPWAKKLLDIQRKLETR
jgi:hypothetical protein